MRYRLFAGPLTWHEARGFCHSFGARLAATRFGHEHARLRQQAADDPRLRAAGAAAGGGGAVKVWLGGFDLFHEDAWRWEDGAPVGLGWACTSRRRISLD